MMTKYGKWLSGLMLVILIAAVPFACSASPSLRASAQAAAQGLGKVMQVKEAKSNSAVYLFEENHTSRAGQIEIAHMLVRLYRDQRVRTIGLEGFSGEKLQAPWAARMSSNRKFQVSGRLLGDGELNSAEFMALTYPDVSVVGIDSEKDYAVELPQRAGAAPLLYLLLIAEKTMPESSKKKFDELFQANKKQEAMDFALNSDPWTKRKYEESRSRRQRESVDAQLRYLSSVEDEAKRRGIEVPAELEQSMQELRKFYAAADRRSDAMVERLVKLAKAGPPVAGIIGAAHTEKMIGLLAKQGVAVAVIRPNALSDRENSPVDPIETAGYERKIKGLPVNERGLGGLLSTKRKPPPVLMQSWLEHKAGVYEATAAVVDSVLINLDRPPYKFATSLPAGYVVDPKTVSVVDEEVIFALRVPGSSDPIWVRAARSIQVNDMDKRRADIDERISRLLDEAESDGRGPPKKPPQRTRGTAEPPEPPGGKGKKGTPREGTVRVTPDIYARFSNSEEVIKKESALKTAL